MPASGGRFGQQETRTVAGGQNHREVAHHEIGQAGGVDCWCRAGHDMEADSVGLRCQPGADRRSRAAEGDADLDAVTGSAQESPGYFFVSNGGPGGDDRQRSALRALFSRCRGRHPTRGGGDRRGCRTPGAQDQREENRDIREENGDLGERSHVVWNERAWLRVPGCLGPDRFRDASHPPISHVVQNFRSLALGSAAAGYVLVRRHGG